MSFAGVASPLLYVSSSQINVAVPAGSACSNLGWVSTHFSTMQVSVNGVPAPPRELPLAPSNPSLFGDLSGAVSARWVTSLTTAGSWIWR